MKQYRLKKDAVKFFTEDIATSIHMLDTWEDLKVDKNALEEVEDPYISFGHEHTLPSGTKGSSLSGWSSDTSNPRLGKGSHFHFTIHFPSVDFHEHDKFAKGRMSREMMDMMQSRLNDFYVKFATSKD